MRTLPSPILAPWSPGSLIHPRRGHLSPCCHSPPSTLYLGSYHSPSPRPPILPLLTSFPFPRILFWTDWDASLPRIEAASMSGAGRRTIHRETGSGGWPNGLTVDYLEKRILWIDARSVPSTIPRRPLSFPPLQGQGGPGSQDLAVRGW